MKIINKDEITTEALPGRGLKRAIGKNSTCDSKKMTVGYALYSTDYGLMEPHQHAEETVIITQADGGSVSWGKDKHNLEFTQELKSGMILHIPENEWHVFNYKENGFVEIIFIYGDTNNLRPEDKKES